MNILPSPVLAAPMVKSQATPSTNAGSKGFTITVDILKTNMILTMI